MMSILKHVYVWSFCFIKSLRKTIALSVVEVQELFFLSLASILPRLSICDGFRTRLCSLAGMQVHKTAKVWFPIIVRPIGKLPNVSIDENSFVNTDIRIGCHSKVLIGKKVQVGPRVCFETTGHSSDLDYLGRRQTVSKPIEISDYAWIGAGAVILQGVHVGKGAVVAAGAIVTRNVEAYTVVGGTPAHFIKALPRRNL